MFQYVDHMAVADLGGGGSGGCNPPQKLRAIRTKCTTNTVLRHRFTLAMSMVAVVVSSEQVVKPHSRQTVVKPRFCTGWSASY